MNPGNNVFPNLPERLSGLADLAENMWWSWRPRARMLFKMLDRQAWKESGHNPDKMLREFPAEMLTAAAQNPEYLRHYDVMMSIFRAYMKRNDQAPGVGTLGPKEVAVAYFSAEYGLHRSLPFYAGGLGFLAGDFIKECSDLNIPLVAVGFMYPEGYLLQKIREDGWQENIVEHFDREAASISRVKTEDGTHWIIKVPLIDPPIYVAVWKVAVGSTPSISWIRISNRTPPGTDPSPRGFTGGTWNSACVRRSSWESAVRKCWRSWASAIACCT